MNVRIAGAKRDASRLGIAKSDAMLYFTQYKVCSDHVYMFISFRQTQNVSKIIRWLKGKSSRIPLTEYTHLRNQFWGRHLWARGYLAVSSGNITDEMIQKYIEEQDGEPVTDDGPFQIDPF